MTLLEMRDILLHYLHTQGDIEVKVTWEGQIIPFNRDNVYLTKDRILIFDADNNLYKDDLTP